MNWLTQKYFNHISIKHLNSNKYKRKKFCHQDLGRIKISME
jgi:hypothetical protein